MGVSRVRKSKSERTSIRWACSKFLRQTFHEFAHHSLPRCDWAKAFYESQRAKNKRHHTAIRALAFKWIRILYRCWKTNTPYDESVYLTALQRRNSPHLKSLNPPLPDPA